MEVRPVFPLKTKGSAGRRLLVYTVQVYLLAGSDITGETSVMDVRAAVAIEAGKPLEVTTVQLEGPREAEVLIEVKATGICHPDAFTLSGADPEGLFQASLGQGGPGVGSATGRGGNGLKEGDTDHT